MSKYNDIEPKGLTTIRQRKFDYTKFEDRLLEQAYLRSMEPAIMAYFKTIVKIDNHSGCWFSDPKKDDLPGSILIGFKKSYPYTRVAAYLRQNVVDGKEMAMHTCLETKCFNPDHMTWGDKQDVLAWKKKRKTYQSSKSPVLTLRGCPFFATKKCVTCGNEFTGNKQRLSCLVCRPPKST